MKKHYYIDIEERDKQVKEYCEIAYMATSLRKTNTLDADYRNDIKTAPSPKLPEPIEGEIKGYLNKYEYGFINKHSPIYLELDQKDDEAHKSLINNGYTPLYSHPQVKEEKQGVLSENDIDKLCGDFLKDCTNNSQDAWRCLVSPDYLTRWFIKKLNPQSKPIDWPSEEEKSEITKLLECIKEKSANCAYSTKESRARKGAYVDCIMIIENWLKERNESK
jgi:hypothetical protein